jgi:hypothetical protein
MKASVLVQGKKVSELTMKASVLVQEKKKQMEMEMD